MKGYGLKGYELTTVVEGNCRGPLCRTERPEAESGGEDVRFVCEVQQLQRSSGEPRVVVWRRRRQIQAHHFGLVGDDDGHGLPHHVYHVVVVVAVAVAGWWWWWWWRRWWWCGRRRMVVVVVAEPRSVSVFLSVRGRGGSSLVPGTVADLKVKVKVNPKTLNP